MLLNSTRNKEKFVSFAEGIQNCIPADGGMYIPKELQDLRRWLLYTNENTSFQSIAGTLTSAFLNEEFSPIICEKIATDAFPFSPVIKQLNDNLFLLELYHGFTGSHRDFGVSYLCSCLETMHTLNGGSSIFLGYTSGELGAILANTLKGKKHVKAVLLYSKNSIRGLEESDLIWNGGNILPLESEEPESVNKDMIRAVFEDREFVEKYHLTVADSANFGRLMPHMFFFPYAFSRIKNKVSGDIYYALDPGNFSNLVAGLYSWRFALPLGGFFIPKTSGISTDVKGNTFLMDSFVDINQRSKIDPCEPSNIERLEEVFSANPMMIRNFVYPVNVNNHDSEESAKELFKKYGIFSDKLTARAYSTIKQNEEILMDDGGSVVLIARDDPSLNNEFCRHTIGEFPERSDNVAKALSPFRINKPFITCVDDLKAMIATL